MTTPSFRKKFLSLIFLLCLHNVNAQNKTLDSLHQELKLAKHDTLKTDILLEIGTALYMSDPDTALYFWTQAKVLAEKNIPLTKDEKTKKVYLSRQGTALSNIGFIHDSRGESVAALLSYQKALEIEEKLGDQQMMAVCLNNIGLTYQHMSNPAKAIEYYNQALLLQKKVNDKYSMSGLLNNIGFVYNDQGNIVKALEYYMKALKIQEELKDKRSIAISLINIGLIHGSQGDTALQLQFYERSLKLREEINDQWGIANSLNNIAGVLDRTGKKEKAIEYYKRSLVIKEGIADKNGIAYTLHQIGALYYRDNDFATALDYYQKGLEIREAIGDKKGQAHSLVSISNAKFKLNKVAEAQSYSERSLKIANELGFPLSIQAAARSLKKIYQKQRNFEKSLEMYELEIKMKDSLSNEETKKISAKKQIQYEYDKKAAADSTRNFESRKVINAQVEAQKAQLKQERTQRYALIFGLLILVVFAGFIFRSLRITRKQKDIIELQKSIVEQHQKDVTDSILYARRIQRSLLPTEKYIERSFKRLMKK